MLQKKEIRRRLDVIPPVSLSLGSEVELFAPGKSRPVEVEVTAFRAGVAGTVQLEAPAGWKVKPASQSFHLAKAGDRARFKFTVTAPAESATAKIIASAEIGGVRYQNERKEINYPHIPLQLLQPPASLKAVSLDLAIRGRKIGYLPGAGDSVADSLKQMGYTVTTLTDADLTPERLHGLDAVVIGVRAFNVRTNLAAHLPGLFAYVEAGGTVVAQYNRPENSRTLKLAPYDLRLSGDRVTDENAAGNLSRAGPSGAEHAEQNHRCRFRRAGCRSAGFISRTSGTNISRRSSRAAIPAKRRSRADCSSRRTARVITSIPVWCFSGSFRRACPAPTGCLPTWFRWGNETAR